MHDPILWLNDEQVSDLLSPALALDAVEKALMLHAQGLYQQPLKPYIRPGGRENERERGRVILMGAYLGGSFDVIGAKVIAGFPRNIESGLPRASGIVMLNSAKTGFPLAIMECGELSARRTAAVARLCVQTLAGPGNHDVAIFGAGPIAAAVIESLAGQSGITRCVLYDPRQDRAHNLAEKARSWGMPISVASDMASALALVDTVVLATSGAKGYLTRDLAGKKALVVALSLDDADEGLFLAADKIVVDSFDDCNREEKLLHRLVQRGLFSREQVHAELGEILLGRKPGRERPLETIYVNPMGMAIEDVAVAWAVYQAARGRGTGMFLT